jgi:hypothetical protein
LVQVALCTLQRFLRPATSGAGALGLALFKLCSAALHLLPCLLQLLACLRALTNI